MTGVEIFKCLAAGRLPDRIPFVPTVYEHAAGLLHVVPSRMATDIDLIVEGQMLAYALYRHDLVSVGVDIYNVEAEALGCLVAYHEMKDDSTASRHWVTEGV
jgi:uroporphyrinogen decarboxylase